jgi:predicted Zn finger-like uncharacterized protein
MIIVCNNCNSRLQVDEGKLPGRPFTIRCPKCNGAIESGVISPASEKGALTVGGSPSTEHPRFEQAAAAPLFEPGSSEDVTYAISSETQKLVELLSTVLSQHAKADAASAGARPAWNRRRVLVCMPETNREMIARRLTENGYQVFVAKDTRQAVERMRENQLEIVLLDPQFDPVEQGGAFVMREVNIMRPSQRRRLFFTLLSTSFRTLDAHAAFLNNANAVVNTNDLEGLPKILEQGMRAYNDLYQEFNIALKVSAL